MKIAVDIISRIVRDRILTEAAALSYKTLLGLIPAMLVAVGAFAYMPAASELRDELASFAADNLMPVFVDVINDNVASLIQNGGRITFASFIVLLIMTMWLVHTIVCAINRIWRGGRRSLGSSIAIYWAMITLGPVSLALLIYITSKVLSYAIHQTQGMGFSLMIGYFILPIIVETVFMSALFLLVPVAPVKFRDAAMGGVFFTIFFEISKKAFTIFVVNFSNYELLYGALAAIPVLMIWIYINWIIVLISAEFTALLGKARQANSDDVPSFMVKLAEMTGSTSGNDSLTRKNRQHVKIRITKRRGAI